jgi:hypothetical protein
MSAVKGLGTHNGQASITVTHRGTDDEEAMYVHYESAARAYLGLLGQSADDLVQIPHPSIAKARVSIERWKLSVPELRAFDVKWMALGATVQDRMGVSDAPP